MQRRRSSFLLVFLSPFSRKAHKAGAAFRLGKNSWIKGSRVVGGREGVNPFASRWNTAFTLELCTYARCSRIRGRSRNTAFSSRRDGEPQGAGFPPASRETPPHSHSHGTAKVFINEENARVSRRERSSCAINSPMARNHFCRVLSLAPARDLIAQTTRQREY